MAKKNKNIFSIFTEAVGLYFSNFGKFFKYMSFPVLGQIAGLLIVFFITYVFTLKMPDLIEKFPQLNDYKTLITLSVIITLPGLAIFVKAFWEYVVAYGAINSMYENMSKSGRVYDFSAHTELIKRRTPAFVGLWLLLGIITLIAVLPPFWIICGIFAVYFVLVFQIFTFEPEQSPIGCFKRSLILIKGKFAKTFLLICLAGALTYLVIPQVILKLLTISGVTNFVSNLILPIVNIFPQINLEQYNIPAIQNSDIALFTFETIVAQILIQYTLPLRSILWSLWYKECNKTSKTPYVEIKSSSKKKRPSEKLMEASKKKYSSKKRVDTNILKRAMEKDDDEE